MKQIIILLGIVLVSIVANGQQGNDQAQIIAESGFPLNGYKPGFGGYLKGFMGVGNNGQISFTFGVAKFSDPDPDTHHKTTTTLIPFLAGYRHNIIRFYIEPQLGFGAFNGNIDIGGDRSKPSNGAFFWAINGGYTYKRIDIGLRYQQAHRSNGDVPGYWEDRSFGFAAAYFAFSLYCPSCSSFARIFVKDIQQKKILQCL